MAQEPILTGINWNFFALKTTSTQFESCNIRRCLDGRFHFQLERSALAKLHQQDDVHEDITEEKYDQLFIFSVVNVHMCLKSETGERARPRTPLSRGQLRLSRWIRKKMARASQIRRSVVG
ncbi:hypothetical protein TNCV_4118331 [Trichonephila clavipes]|nr:hypothetical protein TNCV_4118331 [Trichonephila clavipes]